MLHLRSFSPSGDPTYRATARDLPRRPRTLRVVLGMLVMLGAVLGTAGAASAQTSPPLQECNGDGPRPSFAGHALPLTGGGSAPFGWTRTFSQLSFDFPILLTHAPDGSDRIFVVEQTGRIIVFPNDPAVEPAETTVFLDLSATVFVAFEAGLLGLAFAPDYATSGHLYVNYIASSPLCTTGSRCTRVERYTVSSDPDVVDAASGELLLEFRQQADNHNGGMLAFGPQDGWLYISTGDGGGGGDTFDNGQDLSTLPGAMLRIAPNPPGSVPAYAIPAENPYAGNNQGIREEIWAHGVRNVWRFSFDRLTGDVWMGDVGQGAREEVDFVPAAEVLDGGHNFGWPLCEGTRGYPSGGACNAPGTDLPIFDYPRSQGRSVVGGVVYRGTRLPGLYGTYVYADFYNATRGYVDGDVSVVADGLTGFAAFGEDEAGELYGVNLSTGGIYELAPNDFSGGLPDRLSDTGLFSSLDPLTPVSGLIEYQVVADLWSDGAIKRRWIAAPDGEQIGFDATGAWSFPVGTTWVKHFELRLADGSMRKVETRVFLRQQDRFAGWTYRWNPSQTDADLVVDAEQADFLVDGDGGPVTQTWNFPGPADCLSCHTTAAGRVLGVRARQLNFDVPCETTSESQLDVWNALGLFDTDIGPASDYEAYAPIGNGLRSFETRSRSYLDANCAMCHQPTGPASIFDVRYDTPIGETQLIDVPPSGDAFGIADARRIAPQDSARSVLWHRVQSAVPAERMPPGSNVPDAVADIVVRAWIDAMAEDGTNPRRKCGLGFELVAVALFMPALVRRRRRHPRCRA